MTKELLPFNLEEALKDPARVVYRNGERPLEWHWLEKASENQESIVSVSCNGTVLQHYQKGGFYSNITCQNDLLLLPPPEETYWANVYKNERGVTIGRPHDSEEKAKSSVLFIDHYVKTISFTI